MPITTGMIPKAVGGAVKAAPANAPLLEEERKIAPKVPYTKKHGMAFGKKNKKLAYVPPEKQ